MRRWWCCRSAVIVGRRVVGAGIGHMVFGLGCRIGVGTGRMVAVGLCCRGRCGWGRRRRGWRLVGVVSEDANEW